MWVIFFFLGLVVGSFLNVVVYRLNVAETILGRSHCPNCKKKINWYDNIPLLSFALLRARCRECEERISWQYPLVELGTAMVFALVGYYFFIPEFYFSWVTTLFYLLAFSFFAIVFVYDFLYLEIPMLIVWLGAGASALYWIWLDANQYQLIQSLFDLNIVWGLIGGFAGAVFFWALAKISREKWMGYGDAYAGFMVGIFLGWPLVVSGLILSFILGGIYGTAAIISKKKTMKSQIPYAPFLVLGAFLSIFVPRMLPVIAGYFALF